MKTTALINATQQMIRQSTVISVKSSPCQHKAVMAMISQILDHNLQLPIQVTGVNAVFRAI